MLETRSASAKRRRESYHDQTEDERFSFIHWTQDHFASDLDIVFDNYIGTFIYFSCRMASNVDESHSFFFSFFV